MDNDYDLFLPIPSERPLSLDLQRSLTALSLVREKDRCEVTLTIWHPTRGADEIKTALRATPSAVHNLGEVVAPGYDMTFDQTVCKYSAAKVDVSYLESAVKSLLGRFEGYTPTFRQWVREGARIELGVRIFAWARTQSMSLAPDTVLRLAHMGVSLDYMCHYENSEADY